MPRSSPKNCALSSEAARSARCILLERCRRSGRTSFNEPAAAERRSWPGVGADVIRDERALRLNGPARMQESARAAQYCALGFAAFAVVAASLFAAAGVAGIFGAGLGILMLSIA